MRYLKANQIMDELKISRPTLKTWKDSGKIKYKKISDKKYLYDIIVLWNLLHKTGFVSMKL